MSKRPFKGVWIPAFIWTSTEITWIEKALLAEINSLDDDTGCFASNKHLAESIQSKSPASVRAMISKLRSEHWIYDKSPQTNTSRRISVVATQAEREALTNNNAALTNVNATPPHLMYKESTNEITHSERELIKVKTVEEEIYEEYPKKVGKPKALQAIKKALKKTTREALLVATKKLAELWKNAQDYRFCPCPEKFYNQEMFNDDPKFWPSPAVAKEPPSVELKRLQDQKSRHPCNPEYVAHNPNSTQAQKEAYRAIKTRIKELEAIVGQ